MFISNQREIELNEILSQSFSCKLLNIIFFLNIIIYYNCSGLVRVVLGSLYRKHIESLIMNTNSLMNEANISYKLNFIEFQLIMQRKNEQNLGYSSYLFKLSEDE